MKHKTILILTDSVALPREIAKTTWEDTYIFKLKEHFKDYQIINVSIGGASIVDIKNQINYYKILKPKIVILQCGIVDAAPRAFGRVEIQIIKKTHLFRFTKPFVSILRKYRKHHYCDFKNFHLNLKYIKRELNATKFYSIGIIPASIPYEKKLPGVTKSIKKYNDILKKETFFLSTAKLPKNGILEDHHHINKIGLNYIYNLIIDNIDY